jgi:hypothetical protein
MQLVLGAATAEETYEFGFAAHHTRDESGVRHSVIVLDIFDGRFPLLRF